MKEAFTLFLLALLIVPPLWGIRRMRRVLRSQAAAASTEKEKTEGDA